jgi:hypothetical protein
MIDEKELKRRAQFHYDDKGALPDCIRVSIDEWNELNDSIFKKENEQQHGYGDRYLTLEVTKADGIAVQAWVRIAF